MNRCADLADVIVEALETGQPGAVRAAVADHAQVCPICCERAGEAIALAAALDPVVPAVGSSFVSRVMQEIRGEEAKTPIATGSYDRLPPLWQVFGAAVLFVALTAIVLASGSNAESEWHTRALTGFMDQALGFLGGMSQGVRGLWDAVVPGKALPLLVGCAVLATALNIGFFVSAWRRARKQTVE